jgi:hypothetical protein
LEQAQGAGVSDLAKKLKLGATGAFPRGKLNRTDEGELRMAISNNGELVRIDFGKPVAWLGLRPNEAKEFAALLMQHAASCQQKPI